MACRHGARDLALLALPRHPAPVPRPRMRRGESLLDQRTVLEPADQPRDRSLAEATRVRTSLVLMGLACLLACLAVLAEMFRASPFLGYGFDPVFTRLAGAALTILAGAFLSCSLAAEARLSTRRDEKRRPQAPAHAQEPPRHARSKLAL